MGKVGLSHQIPDHLVNRKTCESEMSLNLYRVPDATEITIDDIPEEVLALVLLHLRPSDRLNSALTCRRWAQLMSSSNMLRNIRLHIAGCEMNVAASFLSRSTRQHRGLLLSNAKLSEYNYMFWNAIKGSLRELELSGCQWSPAVLSTILRQCRRLEILKFDPEARTRDLPRDIFGEFHIPDNLKVREIRFSPRSDERDTLHKGGRLQGTAQRSTQRSGICRLLRGPESAGGRREGGRHGPRDRRCRLLKAVRRVLPGRFSLPRSLLRILQGDGDLRSQLGAVPEMALMSLTADEYYFEGHPSIVHGPRREIFRLELSSRHLYAQGIDLLRRSSGTLQELTICIRKHCRGIAEAVGACTKLRYLKLSLPDRRSGYEQVGTILRNAPNLEELDIIPDFKVKDSRLWDISKLQQLKRFTLRSFTNVSHVFPRQLGTISTLQCVRLDGVEVNSSHLRVLASLKNLRELYIRFTHRLDSECFEIICESFENLEELSLDYLHALTDADGVKLRRLRNLRVLGLHTCCRFTDLTFKEVLGSGALTDLKVSDSPLTDTGLASIASNHRMLRKLHIGYCDNITDDGIISLLQRGPLLQKITLDRCRALRGGLPGKLENLCPRPRSIKILSLCGGREILLENREQRRVVRVTHFYD